MSVTILSNKTRYKTADLEAFIDWVEAETKEALSPENKNMWNGCTEVNVTTAGPQHPYLNGFDDCNSVPIRTAMRRTFSGPVPLKIVAPKHVEETDVCRALALSLKYENKLLSSDARKELLHWCFSAGQTFRSYGSAYVEAKEIVVRKLDEAPEVRVLARCETPSAYKAKTKEEKIAMYLEKFGNPTMAMGGSSRDSAWSWSMRVSEANQRYETEWHRRDKWRQKAIELGAEVEPHRTFADYLREIARGLDRRRS